MAGEFCFVDDRKARRITLSNGIDYLT